MRWLHEPGTREAVQSFIHVEPMTTDQIAAMRDYLCRWIGSAECHDRLRDSAEKLATRGAIEAWVNAAAELGIDPI